MSINAKNNVSNVIQKIKKKILSYHKAYLFSLDEILEILETLEECETKAENRTACKD